MAFNIDDMRRLLELDQKCRVFWDHGVQSIVRRRRALDKDDKSTDEVVFIDTLLGHILRMATQARGDRWCWSK